MGGETERNESGWTIDTLNYAITQRINDLIKLLDERAKTQDKAVQAALQSAEKAVTKAETAAEKRFEGVNEFRRTLSDQAQLFLPRTEYDAAHDNLVERVNGLDLRVTRAEGRNQGSSSFAGWVVAGVSVLISVVSVIIAANAVFGK